MLLGTESLQTFGGSGFLQDYPLEQYVRDAKIDTLYEGTTAIQGMDFFFRKIVRDKGQALSHLAQQIGEFAKAEVGDGRLAAERELLGQALEDVQGDRRVHGRCTDVGRPAGRGRRRQRNVYKVGQNTTRLLLASGDLVIGWLLLQQAEVALARLDATGSTAGSSTAGSSTAGSSTAGSSTAGSSTAGSSTAGGGVSAADRAFYQGKVAAARFFARQVLPRLSAERQIALATDNAVMELPEDAF